MSGTYDVEMKSVYEGRVRGDLALVNSFVALLCIPQAQSPVVRFKKSC